jgi:curved DNA-binding protein CbpA
MKPLSELDHYEVLEVERDALSDEIERAYHVARSAYAEGSLATYSVFGERDTEALRHRIELAFRTLSDPETRRSYDQNLGGGFTEHDVSTLSFDPLLDSVARRLTAEEPPAPARATGSPRSAPPADMVAYRDVDPDDQTGDCDGARLRRARLKRGLEIEQIAAITKINSSYLRSIEEDALEQLPAQVYVRGFVKAFARFVGLEPVQASASYMTRFEVVQPRKRGRILGRQPQV